MKKFLIVALIFCGLHGNGFCQTQVFKNTELTITQFEPNMWIIETSDNNTMFIVEGTKKAMLIDTGTKNTKLDSIVRLITKKPLLLVLTHAHGDHAGNIGFFKEIYMHPADTFFLGKSYKGKINFIKDGEIFDLGETKIDVSHMPAHTPGSIVLLDRKAGNCYSGDAFGGGEVWLQLKPCAPIKTFISSCDKMEKLMDNGIARVYCGHYPYLKKAFDKSHITNLRILAELIESNKAPNSKPFANRNSISSDNPMIANYADATIVYDPESVK